MTELLEWRNRYGVEQGALASLLGVSRATVMRYEEHETMSQVLRLALLGILFKHPPGICPCYGCQEARYKEDPTSYKKPEPDLRTVLRNKNGRGKRRDEGRKRHGTNGADTSDGQGDGDTGLGGEDD